MIRHRIRLPLTQVAMAVLIGIAGGVYIYKPCFEPVRTRTATSTTNQMNPEEQKKENQTN
ncbi:protein PIGBOS1 [Boleophthalmus pectinirostris]|uniref:protein PIGBOS1 n=1 Tax=Boleophthalmus pectinirostris TaxID=150288 RepID=UPI002430848B|nr:protein PIGBOS1 [Boleophthalmus pectinirostris]